MDQCVTKTLIPYWKMYRHLIKRFIKTRELILEIRLYQPHGGRFRGKRYPGKGGPDRSRRSLAWATWVNRYFLLVPIFVMEFTGSLLGIADNSVTQKMKWILMAPFLGDSERFAEKVYVIFCLWNNLISDFLYLEVGLPFSEMQVMCGVLISLQFASWARQVSIS